MAEETEEWMCVHICQIFSVKSWKMVPLSSVLQEERSQLKNVKGKQFMERNACKGQEGRNRKGHTVQSLGKERGPCRKSSKLQPSKANARALFCSAEELSCFGRNGLALGPFLLSHRLGAAWLHMNSVIGQHVKWLGMFSQQDLGMRDLGGTFNDLLSSPVFHRCVSPGTFRGQLLHGSCEPLFLKGHFKEGGLLLFSLFWGACHPVPR